MNDWENKYLLNIEIIDEQHRGFFKIIENEIKDGDNNNKDLSKFILFLENYLNEHFNTEERLLELSGYDDIENHKAQHIYFIDRINKMKLELDYNNPMLYKKLIDFMKKWFLSHILNTDKKYGDTVVNYLQNK